MCRTPAHVNIKVLLIDVIVKLQTLIKYTYTVRVILSIGCVFH